MPTAIQDPAPDWIKQLRPANASVLDPWWKSPARTIVSLLGLDDPQSQVMGIMAGVNTQEAATLLERFPRLAKVIKAYHGSPHDFEAFDISKIGTGEGNQAFGHGLYFAENPAVGRDYRNSLAVPTVTIGGEVKPNPSWDASLPPEQRLIRRLGDVKVTHVDPQATTADVIAETRKRLGRELVAPYGDKVSAQRELDLLQQFEAQGIQVDRGGKMYEVGIHADPEHFVDLDKPLSQQSKAVQDAFHWYGVNDPTMSGMDAYNKLGGSEGIHGSTRSLIEIPHDYTPIPGLKYLDQGSRQRTDIAFVQEQIQKTQEYVDRLSAIYEKNPGDPRLLDAAKDSLEFHKQILAEGLKEPPATRNYVVFDDALIEIRRKYGWVLPAAVGAQVEYLRRKANQQGGKIAQSDLDGI